MRLERSKRFIPVTICVTVRRDYEEQKAILVHDGTQQFWLPRSQIKYRKENNDGSGTEAIRIPMWLAVEKGVEFDIDPPEDEIPF
jgi:hypothetical protein